MSISRLDTQEAGRGGRDGSVAKAFLIWSPADSMKFGSFPAGSRESAMRDFAESRTCRRQVLLDALGAEQAVCSGCDICTGDDGVHEADFERALSLVRKSPRFFTTRLLDDALYAQLNQRYRQLLGVNVWTHSDCEEITSQLLKSGKMKKGGFLWKNRLFVPRNFTQREHS